MRTQFLFFFPNEYNTDKLFIGYGLVDIIRYLLGRFTSQPQQNS